MKKISKRKPLLLAAISLSAFIITAMSASCTPGQDADAAANKIINRHSDNKNASAVKKGISLNEFFDLPFENSVPEELPFSEEKAAPSENEGTQSYEGGVLLSQADFSTYEKEMVKEDWEAFSEFFPVLLEETPIWAMHCPNVDEEPEEPMKEQRILDFFQEESDTSDFMLTSFALCDITQDGQKELVLYTYRYGGWYWVLHREGNIFYGVYMPIRWFQDLQKNGIHLGSGGSGHTYYHRLHFEDGTFRKELLGRTDWEEGMPCYYIDGKEVSETEFESWSEERMTGNVQWYNPHSAALTKFSKNH